MNSKALITLAKESSQSDVLCPENLLKMLSACYDKNGRAEWYLNQELMALLLLFRKKARSARMFACKRARNGLLSLPLFCEEIAFGA